MSTKTNWSKQNKIIGQALKEVREEKGWTREQLAMYSGLAERTIQNVELGYNMSTTSLGLLIEALGIKAAKLYAL